MNVTKLTMADPAYVTLHRQINKAAGADVKVDSRVKTEYNALALQYNTLKGEEYISIEGFTKSVANLHNIFKNRGVNRDTDYVLYLIATDERGRKLPKEQKKVVLKRLTSREMRLI